MKCLQCRLPFLPLLRFLHVKAQLVIFAAPYCVSSHQLFHTRPVKTVNIFILFVSVVDARYARQGMFWRLLIPDFKHKVKDPLAFVLYIELCETTISAQSNKSRDSQGFLVSGQ